MVIGAAVVLFLVTVLAIDHHDELRTRFGFARKSLLPPLNFSQWTIVAPILAISAVVAAILVLGIVEPDTGSPAARVRCPNGSNDYITRCR